MRMGRMLRVLLGDVADFRISAIWDITPAEEADIHAGLIAGLENGTLCPVVGKELPLAEAARTHKEILEPGASGRIVLICDKRRSQEAYKDEMSHLSALSPTAVINGVDSSGHCRRFRRAPSKCVTWRSG